MQPHPQRYGFEIAQRPPLPETAADIEAVRRDGFVVLERLITPAHCDAIREETARLLKGAGRNAFEGFNTQRVYNVLTKTRLLDDLIDHPRVLALLDQLFEPNYLLSQAQLINIRPGEAAQALHYDDGFYKVPRPRPALGAATIWAIDAFTEDNGATAIVPRSHDWGQSPVPTPAQTIPCVMPAGSAVFFVGTLWHGGGGNHTNSNRLAFTAQYCAPWLRQQENFFLEVPRETVRILRPTLQSLIGYSIYPPFMGMVDSMHPKRVLDA
ncbi:phytanoyl-CoA dioxygenase family protein [Reyranella sp. CPCC 100927]|uniref:phytanoyl-CoA dioxygenase family protein n=1 Tax=Reyranella sp. CPCC 100927 TaxID=2599616 RepID=UPI0011B606F8|nr:phytanoyl-CoA dioxygenase family protein [Reyranella sp. CPCC 100927]TWT10031.1 phytanoyl-CoA dioxygenase family protein [Reyranella sp. CPCC 100927]